MCTLLEEWLYNTYIILEGEYKMTYVRTKEELQAAIDRKDDEIIVVGELAEKIKPIVKLKRFSENKIARVMSLVPVLCKASKNISVLSGLGRNVVSSGLGGMLNDGTILRRMPPKSVQGFTGPEIIIIIMVVTATGLAIIALQKDYDVDLSMHPIEGIRFKAKRKKKDVEEDDVNCKNDN